MRIRRPRTIREWIIAAGLLLLFVALSSGLFAPFAQDMGRSVGLLSTTTPTPRPSATRPPSATPVPPVITVPGTPTRRSAIFPTATTTSEQQPVTFTPEVTDTPTLTPEPSPSPLPPSPVSSPLPPSPVPSPLPPSPVPAPLSPSPTSVPASPTSAPVSPTATSGPTATPTPTFPPPADPPPPSFNGCQDEPNAAAAPDYPVRILDINKETEVFALQNVGTVPVDLGEWVMCSMNGSQELDRMRGALEPGQTRRFVFPGAGVWSNTQRDDGALYNARGQLISYWFDS
jgi:hypothetical protein